MAEISRRAGLHGDAIPQLSRPPKLLEALCVDDVDAICEAPRSSTETPRVRDLRRGCADFSCSSTRITTLPNCSSNQ